MSGECGDHCGSHLRLISRSGKCCCSHANDSFEEWGWHHLAGTTGGPWRPLSVDQVLFRTCQAPGHIARCWLSQTARCRPRTRMVQWCHVWRLQPRQCTSQSVMAFADSAQGCVLPQWFFIRAVSWSAQNAESHWSHVHITLTVEHFSFHPFYKCGLQRDLMFCSSRLMLQRR